MPPILPDLTPHGRYLTSQGVESHFTSAETACRCGRCRYRLVTQEVIDLAERLRLKFGVLHVNSGVRCPVHNRAVGGVEQSRHLPDDMRLGHALDLTPRSVPVAVVADQFDAWYPNSYGMGRYPNFIHIDDRIRRARW